MVISKIISTNLQNCCTHQDHLNLPFPKPDQPILYYEGHLLNFYLIFHSKILFQRQRIWSINAKAYAGPALANILPEYLFLK